MLLRANRPLLYFEVSPCIGSIGLIADFVTKTNDGKDTHDPDWSRTI